MSQQHQRLTNETAARLMLVFTFVAATATFWAGSHPEYGTRPLVAWLALTCAGVAALVASQRERR